MRLGTRKDDYDLLREECDRLREALERIDAGWAAPPKGAPDLIHWTQVIAREALASHSRPVRSSDA